MDNRIIKFRAWDTEKQIMTGSPFAITNNIQQPWMLVRDYDKGGWKGEATIRLIPMQFTGLFDKNNKEIYERDILKGLNRFGKETNYEIVFSNGSWTALAIAFSFNITIKHSREMEVIGNIYENPELLK